MESFISTSSSWKSGGQVACPLRPADRSSRPPTEAPGSECEANRRSLPVDVGLRKVSSDEGQIGATHP